MKTDFVEIFQTIRAVLQPYTAQGFVNRTNSEDTYDLWSEKHVEIDRTRITEHHFAAVIIHSDFVGFYLIPIGTMSEIREGIDPQLMALLEDNTCFHIAQLDDVMLNHIESALALGFKLYKEKGWV